MLRLPTSLMLSVLLLSAASFPFVQAHGGHSHGGENYDSHGADDDATLSYAERHMRAEHHLDAFDPESFFRLHDLDQDGVLNVEEIQAIYGLHHDSSKTASSSDDAHAAKAKTITDQVLAILDRDGDGLVTLREFLDAGVGGLPDFEGFGELGHHYDEESEYFLHHEEKYHSTPETQTDESYTHPEDIAHFRHHDKLEAAEDAKAQVFLDAESPTHADAPHEQPPRFASAGRKLGLGSVPVASEGGGRGPSVSERLEGDRREAAGSGESPYGEGSAGYQRPKTARERMRRGTPYKYKFRRSGIDF